MKDKSSGYIRWISLIWAVLSFVLGIRFLKNNYSIGMNNVYSNVVSKSEQVLWLVIAILIAVSCIVLLVKFIVKAVLINGKERQILIFSIPFLVVFIVFFIYKYVNSNSDVYSYFWGDEKNIWDAAVRLYPYFFVYTSEIFLVCFFILPIVLAPVIVKIVLESLIMGYIMWRIKAHYKSNLVYIIYAFCLMPPFLTLGIEVHRMQWYGFLYLFAMVKLYMDIIEGGNINPIYG
ncbi:hypothetical protein SAMN04487831_103303 [Pseudobutyrivibrio sp. UC1225]|uniref:hypothetical protein n=1 Tax=Pseudobutyrivibrio sp. UC1225 TaxID=1798185 RepID=UPI0008EC4758|nr:hypothetical protein [Pseudobutyrivibrio sp. UC1225]SFN78923.1 hypothetical protein SAMN04487831_103303 [Pseudobutyrivibrio sp. UC1225]